jgi:hypothetical protein
MWFNAGVGSSIYISSYLPGIDFLREYISLKKYNNIVETDSKKFIDLANQLTIVQNRQFAGMAIVRYDLGEYHYTFNKNNEPWIGTAVIATSLNKLSQGQLELWNVNYIAGFVCKANVENESSEVFKNISKTFQSDSEWVKRQNQTTLKISGIISDLGEYQSKIYKEIYETKSKTNEEQSKSFSNYLRGVEIVLDKTTGEKYEVKSGRDYYWINKMKNQYVGTDTYANPDQMNLEEVIIIR